MGAKTSFSVWIKGSESKAKPGGRQAPCWHHWPKKAKSEIRRVLEYNDNLPSGEPWVTLTAMQGRLWDEYNIEVSQATILSFARRELERTSWRKA